MKPKRNRVIPAPKTAVQGQQTDTSSEGRLIRTADPVDEGYPVACPEPLFRAFDHVGGGRLDFLRDVEHLRLGLWDLMRKADRPDLAASLILQGLTVQEHLRATDWRPEQCLSMPGPLWAEAEVFFCLTADALLALGGQPRFAKASLAVIAVIDHLKSLCYAKEQSTK